ncbi:MAG: class II aldolase/adducin family protein [Rhodobacteraceae bacterium]|jgi:L-fuculose-phosphate aldolase|nr:class II aldolase/adducin family protein [Paracoccaceae bacterium]
MDRAAQDGVLAALRFLVRAGIVDWNGHASVRVEGGFVVNSAASNRAAMTPEMLCRVALDGTVRSGDRPPNEVHLHAAIYLARADVRAVVHGHPAWLGTLTAAGERLAPVLPQGVLVADLPAYPHSHSISTAERGDAVATVLGAGRGVVLPAHGIVTVGADPVEACVLALYAEQTAERQVRAAPLGGARSLPPEEIAEYARSLDSPGLFAKCWDFILDGKD